MSPEDRMRLLQFVCAIAWSDFQVRDAERAHIERMVERMELPAGAGDLVQRWLASPDVISEVDPLSIPRDQKDRFFAEAGQVMLVDGELHEEEADTLDLLRRLLYGEDGS